MPTLRAALLAHQLATPSRDPVAGTQFLYPKSDGLWYTKNSAGVESPISGTAVTWSTLAGKPSTFPPSAHGHDLTDANMTGIIPDAQLPSRIGPTASAAFTDWNNYQTTGWYRGNGLLNAPGASSWYYVEVLRHDASYCLQIAYDYFADKQYFRRFQAGAWMPWVENMHTGRPPTWTEVTGKPTTFTPAAHTHTLLDLPDAWIKRAVRVATTANITLSGLQTIDGVAVAAGDRVLVKNQTASSGNGIYTVASGAWTRPSDSDIAGDIAGATVSVDQGTLGGQLWSTTFKTTDTLGTTGMNWYQVLDSSRIGVGGGVQAFVNTPANMFHTGHKPDWSEIDNKPNSLVATGFTPVVTGLITASGGGRFNKGGGTNAWDAQVYSAEGYSEGCRVAFRPTSPTGVNLMVGLNTDPTTDADYGGIDYAWYLDASLGWYMYENGVSVGGTAIAALANDQVEIVWDKKRIVYLLNGIERRSVDRSLTTKLYLDSSFYTVSTNGVRDLEFGPYERTRVIITDGFNLPTNGVHGQVIWDSLVPSLRIYDRNSDSWLNQMALVARRTDWPFIPVAGQIVNREDQGRLYIRGQSSQWVPQGEHDVDLASTAPVSPSGFQTVDGVVTVDGDRVLLKDTGTPSVNGIYVVRSGAWERAVDNDSPAKIAGTSVGVIRGNVNSGTRWRTTFRASDTVGSTPMVWVQEGGVGSTTTSICLAQAAGSTTPAANAWTGVGDLAPVNQQGSDITFNAGQGQMTINRTGWYRVNGQISFATGTARAIMRIVWAATVGALNPDANIIVMTETYGSSTTNSAQGSSQIAFLTAGTVVKMYVYETTAVAITQKTFSIEAIGQSSAVDNTGTVALRAYMSATTGQGASTNLGMTAMEDTHGGWGGSSYTAKVAGLYLATAQIKWATAHQVALQLLVNGVVVQYDHNSASGTFYGSKITTTLRLNAGDVVSLRQSGAITTYQNDAVGASNYLHLVRIDAAPDRAADTGWITIPYAANWSAYPGYQVPQYKRQGTRVDTRGLVARGTSTAAALTPCTILPVGFRPPARLLRYSGTYNGSVEKAGRVDITPAGEIFAFSDAIPAGGYISLDGLYWFVD